MTYAVDREGELRLKFGESEVRVLYRRPTPAEMIETLVRKIPQGDETADARRILSANLELGAACITGVGDDLLVDGKRVSPESDADWKTRLTESCPLILIALGQHLSALPAVMGESGLKKS